MAGLDAHFRCSIALFTPWRDKRRIHRSNSSRVCARARSHVRKCQKVHRKLYRSVHTLPVAISVSFSFSLSFSFLPSLPVPFSRSRFIRGFGRSLSASSLLSSQCPRVIAVRLTAAVAILLSSLRHSLYPPLCSNHPQSSSRRARAYNHTQAAKG